MTAITIPERVSELTYMLPGGTLEGATAWSFLCSLGHCAGTGPLACLGHVHKYQEASLFGKPAWLWRGQGEKHVSSCTGFPTIGLGKGAG